MAVILISLIKVLAKFTVKVFSNKFKNIYKNDVQEFPLNKCTSRLTLTL